LWHSKLRSKAAWMMHFKLFEGEFHRVRVFAGSDQQ
jgi:hypothetical protein